jgi:hypothetical protein
MNIKRGAWSFGFGLAIGCAGESTAPVSTQASLVGDWILCEDEACSLLGDDGYRFAADGNAFSLDSRDGPPVEPVCVELDIEPMSYRFENDTFVLGNTSVRATLAGDILTLYDLPYMAGDGTSGTQTAWMLRVQTTVSDMCPGDPPPQGDPPPRP